MWHDMRALYVHKIDNKVKRKPNRKYFSSEDYTDESIGWFVLKATLAWFVVLVGLGTILLIPV